VSAPGYQPGRTGEAGEEKSLTLRPGGTLCEDDSWVWGFSRDSKRKWSDYSLTFQDVLAGGSCALGTSVGTIL